MNTKLLPATFAFCVLALSARAEVQVVQASAASLTAPWTTTVSLPKFNPATGTLTDVRIVVRANTHGSVSFENRSAVTAQATANVTGVVTATIPGAAACSVTVRVPVSVSASAFDGINDFGGTSGGVIANLTGTNTGSTTISQFGTPNPFLGTGNWSVSLSGVNQSSTVAPVNFTMRTSIDIGATIEVTYVYDLRPDCDGDGIPDSAELDSDGDGLPDDCDVLRGPSAHTNRPGSILVFPDYDNSPGSLTLITVTNAVMSGAPPTNVEFVFLSSTCLEFNRTYTMTVGDTISGLVSAMTAGANDRGFIYAFAKSNVSGQAWDYDHLVGSALRMSAFDAYSYGYPAIAFEALTGDLQPTDIDADGIRDLDGIEYAQAPGRLVFPRFLGSTANRSSDLILLNLTGGAAFTATVRLSVMNDLGLEENLAKSFSCWKKDTLDSWTNGFTTNANLQGITPSSPVEVLGAPMIESGWLEVQGLSATSGGPILNDPAILGLLIEKSSSRRAAQMPFFLGEQSNGDLLPHSAAGDF